MLDSPCFSFITRKMFFLYYKKNNDCLALTEPTLLMLMLTARLIRPTGQMLSEEKEPQSQFVVLLKLKLQTTQMDPRMSKKGKPPRTKYKRDGFIRPAGTGAKCPCRILFRRKMKNDRKNKQTRSSFVVKKNEENPEHY